jgi:hypothetical protein
MIVRQEGHSLADDYTGYLKSLGFFYIRVRAATFEDRYCALVGVHH